MDRDKTIYNVMLFFAALFIISLTGFVISVIYSMWMQDPSFRIDYQIEFTTGLISFLGIIITYISSELS